MTETTRLQKYVAEFIGTFALVFIGCGACIAHHRYGSDITHVGVALAFGGVVMCMVYGLGHVSGAHINPAVTVAFTSVGRMPRRDVLPYIGSQCLGAVAASLAHLFTYGGEMVRGADFGATVPAGISIVGSFALEAVLTFLLMLVIMAVATDARVPRAVSGLAIGATVAFDCLAAGKCCGASMNPARSLGPALMAGGTAMKVMWLYALAPVVGAVVAAWTYRYVAGRVAVGDSTCSKATAEA
jgi:MIP family channel proteins